MIAVPDNHPFPNIVRATATDMNVVHFVAYHSPTYLARSAGAVAFYVTDIQESSKNLFRYTIQFALSLCHPLDLPHFNRKQARERAINSPTSEMIVESYDWTRRAFNDTMLNYSVLNPRRNDKIPSWFKYYHMRIDVAHNCNWLGALDRKYIENMREMRDLRNKQVGLNNAVTHMTDIIEEQQAKLFSLQYQINVLEGKEIPV